MGPTDFTYLTPEEAFEQALDTLEQCEKMARDERLCACGQHVWRYSQSGMCFTCVTGESDALGDYEIGTPY